MNTVLANVIGSPPADKGKKTQPAKSDPDTAPAAAFDTPVGDLLPGPIADQIRAKLAKEMESPVTVSPGPTASQSSLLRFEVNTIVQLANPVSVGGFRVWLITGIVLGGTGQESHYQLRPLDQKPGNDVDGKTRESLVPTWMLDTHDQVHAV